MRTFALLPALVGCAVAFAQQDPGNLTVTRGGTSQIQLGWSGGQVQYQVFRSTSPQNLAVPVNLLGQTSGTNWLDTAAFGALLFYSVTGGHCAVASDCGGTDTECAQRTCLSGRCGIQYAQYGTLSATQTAGDCHSNVCDGTGNLISIVDDSDVPVDGNDCTSDLCTNGVPSNPQAAKGTVCTTAPGNRCEGGVCTPTVRVVRVGDGSAALSSSATPAFIEERFPDGTFAGPTVALPSAAAGSNQPCTMSGTAVSEGRLTRSFDKTVLSTAGYAAPAGTASVNATASSSVNRVVCTLDAAGNVTTSTRLDQAFSGSNVRAAVSVDGSAFWVSGNNVSTAGGIWYIAAGSTGGTQVLASPPNVRSVGIFQGQLFGSSGLTPYAGVFTVGSGLPTGSGSVAGLLPGLPMSGGSPYEFNLLDRDPMVPGPDLLYIADDRAIGLGGGIQKWVFDGSVWTLQATFTNGLTSGVRGLAARLRGDGRVVLFGTTADTSQNNLVTALDDFASDPPFTTLATSAANTVYRGVSMSPR